MAGLFGVMDTAGRGIAVAQNGIATTSHNIANVNTQGFSRQRQVVVSSGTLPDPNGTIGTGAEQRSIERIHDSFVQAQIIRQSAATASSDTQASALASVEQVFNEQGSEGISAAISALYSAFSQLSASQTPGAPVEREALRGAASQLVDTMEGADRQLRELQGATQRSIDAVLPEINGITSRIAQLNREIAAHEVVSPANDLRDERDRLVDQLAGKLEINAFEDGNGSTTVILQSGMPLVEGPQSHALVAIADPANPFDPGFSRIGHAGGGASPVDVTDQIGAGELGGLLAVRDTIVPAAIRSLDTIAYNLASSVNTVHASGVGLDGSTGDFFAAPVQVEDAARDLELDAAIVASTDAIAAGLGTGEADNRNALALSALRDQAAPVFLPGDPPGPASGPSRSILDHTATVVADIGLQARVMDQRHEQDVSVSELLASRRDAISGVSLDEEVTQLIQLEAAFQANARVLETIDRLLAEVVGLVG